MVHEAQLLAHFSDQSKYSKRLCFEYRSVKCNFTHRPPQFNFGKLIYMYNPSEIKGFCLKSCHLRPSCNLFTNVMQLSGTNLPCDTVPEAPILDGKTFCSGLQTPIFGKKILQKYPKYQRPHAI